MPRPTLIRAEVSQLTGLKGKRGTVSISASQFQRITGREKNDILRQAYLKRQSERGVKVLGNKRGISKIRFETSRKDIWTVLAGNCQPSISYGRARKRGMPGVPDKTVGRFLCAAPISFKEQSNPSRENDYRVFIEGVEVTAYIRGPLRYTMETTGGINTCTFDLNNNHDAFILTPVNICHGVKNFKGWRIQSYRSNFNVIHGEPRYDELAKYLLYKRKFKKVDPTSPRAEIDPDTGTWLYPLNPYDAVIHKHDTIRVFKRLSHISGTAVKIRNTTRYYDLWVPVFTGFVRSNPWDDDYVTGDRVLHIECFDYRGLMERMRVRTTGVPLKGGANKKGKGSKRSAENAYLYRNLKNSGVRDQVIKLAENAQILNLIRQKKELNLKRLLLACSVQSKNKISDANVVLMGCLTEAYIQTTADAVKDLNAVKGLLADFAKDNKILKQIGGEEAIIPTVGKAVQFKKILSSGQRVILQWQQARNIIQGAVQTSISTNKVLSRGEVKAIQERTRSGNDPYVVVSKVDVRAATATELEKSRGGAIFRITATVVLNASGDAQLLRAFRTYLQRAPTIRYASEKHKQYAESKKGTPEYGDIIYFAKLTANNVDEQVKNHILGKLDFETKGKLQSLRPGGNWLSLASDPRIGNNRNTWIKGINKALPLLEKQVANAKARLRKTGAQLTAIIRRLQRENNVAASQLQLAMKQVGDPVQANIKIANVRSLIERKRQEGKQQLNKRINDVGSLAELITNEPTFDARQAGIFGDLVRAISKYDHPLAGMCYEEAVTWLCCSQSFIVPGAITEIKSYQNSVKQLQDWNKVVLFGVWQRPLTYNEVTVIGNESTSETTNNPFSPLNAFMHLLLPQSGTGARTIVQQDITSNPGQAKTFQHESRKSLIDNISELLAYQWYVSGIGDIIFEFPHYDALPRDFGNTFKGAYTFEKELTGMTVNPEATEMPTAWVIAGMEPEKTGQQKGDAAKKLYTISIMSPILARRLGVKVERIQLQIPGVGAQVGSGKQDAGGIKSLVAWGLLHIQKQIGQYYQISLRDFPERPYLLPNRPMWVIPRQKIFLTRSVSYTLDSPNGDATASVQSSFSRWLNRDGKFRTITGGQRSVINYAGIFTGSLQFFINKGVGNSARGTPAGTDRRNARVRQRSLAAVSCSSDLRKAFAQSSTFYNQDIAGSLQLWGESPSNTVGALSTPDFLYGDPNPPGTNIPPRTMEGTTSFVEPAVQPANVDPGKSSTKYGTKMYRQSLNPGQKTTPFTNVKNAGLRIQTEIEEDKADNTYKISKFFYNPYPFGNSTRAGRSGSKRPFNTYGLLRIHRNVGVYAAGGYDAFSYKRGTYRGNIELPWHAGVDIYISTGKHITAPTNLFNLRARLQIGRKLSHYGKKRYKALEFFHNGKWIKMGKNGSKFWYWRKFDADPAKPKNRMRFLGGRGYREWLVSPYVEGLYSKFTDRSENWKRIGLWRRKSGLAGIVLEGEGNTTLPKSANTTLAGKQVRFLIRFIHLSDILGQDAPGGKKRFYGIHLKEAAAGTPICVVGKTGTPYSHMHCEMFVYMGGRASRNKNVAQTDAEAFREVVRANNEYLTTQLILRFSGGNPDSNELSSRWKKIFRRRRLNITTVDQAVAYFQKRNSNYREQTDFNPVRRGCVSTNPLFFFRPEQLLPAVKNLKWKEKNPLAPNLYSSRYFVFRTRLEDGITKSVGTPVCGQSTEESSKKTVLNNRKCVLLSNRLSKASRFTASKQALAKCKETRDRKIKQAKSAAVKARSKDEQVNDTLAAAIRAAINRSRDPDAENQRG